MYVRHMTGALEDDSRGKENNRARGNRCANCGGELNVLVEIPPHGDPYDRSRPSTRYFRCDRCNHIRIIDR